MKTIETLKLTASTKRVIKFVNEIEVIEAINPNAPKIERGTVLMVTCKENGYNFTDEPMEVISINNDQITALDCRGRSLDINAETSMSVIKKLRIILTPFEFKYFIGR